VKYKCPSRSDQQGPSGKRKPSAMILHCAIWFFSLDGSVKRVEANWVEGMIS